MSRKFLLTGGSGVLGQELQKIAPEYGIEYWAPSSRELDIEDDFTTSWIEKNIGKLKNFVGLVHCAAYTDVPNSETREGRIRAVDLNIRGTNNIADIAFILGLKFTYISTDYVYFGDIGNYSEEDAVRPVNYYAMTKLIGESFSSKPDGLIIRTSFKSNEPWPYEYAFDDLYTSADYVDVIAPKISFLISEFASGVYNVGTERKTVYDLARRRSMVKPMSRKDITSVHLPTDISMNLTKYKEFYTKVCGG